MNSKPYLSSGHVVGFLVACAALLPVPAQAAALGALPQVPLFATTQVKPNVIMAIDDSGSMDGEMLFATNDGALWWNTSSSNQSFVDDSGIPFFNTDGSANSTWKKYVYLFPNGTGTGKRVYSDSSNDHYAVPPLPQFAFARSPDYNRAYFSPDVVYKPWVSYSAQTFADISPSSAPTDPENGRDTFQFNLTGTLKYSGSNQTFRLHKGAVVPKGTVYYDGSWKTASSSFTVSSTYKDYGIEFDPKVYYLRTETGNYSVSGVGSGSCASPNPNHYKAFESNPSGLSGVDALGPDGGCLVAHSAAGDDLQNFANWFSYYRKRHLAMRGGVGRAFDRLSGLRVGLFKINNRVNVSMLDYDTQRDTFYDTLYSFVGSGGTPSREAVNHIGQQYKRTDGNAPITERCQKCAGLLFTDGFASLSTSSGVGNADGGQGSPYADSYSNTMADIAMYYYKNDLRTDLDNDVPVHRDCPDARLDCNAAQHMNTYAVGLGATGFIYGQGYETTDDAYDNPPAWTDVNGERSQKQVDDLYHAAINGRGEMLNARTPAEIADRMEQALRHFVSGIGSASATAFNTATLTDDTRVYIAMFNSNDWSGELRAYNLDINNGQLGAEVWNAAEELDTMTSANRNILTYDGEGSGSYFDWADLTDEQKDDLRTNSDGSQSNDTVAQARLEYIRGERSNEGTNLDFRVRGSLLGDLVYSAPVYVGSPNLSFPGDLGASYRAWADTVSRDPVLYAGGNDGMLHGFDTATGKEVMGYVPGSVYSTEPNAGLHYLSDPDYSHHYYVDLTPTVSDVELGGSWGTVLVGGLRGGGRGYFALDVTTPKFDIGDVMWEFTSADDEDLGFTFSRPSIVKMQNGKWAAIFGNGYNSDNGDAALFIVFLDGFGTKGWKEGQGYVKISTGVGTSASPNGLSSPTVVDLDRDGIADRAYAGDLQGNMWAFDLSAKSLNGWSIDGGQPLFSTPNHQPITSAPSVARNGSVRTHDGNLPNVQVFFGTGQYLVVNDLADISTQSFYSVWDNGAGRVYTSDLVEQTVSTSGDLRTVSNNEVDYTSNARGCYLDLPARGERVVANSLLRGGVVFFNTVIPSTEPCDAGGDGWLMSVAMSNCGAPDEAVFDVNGDNIVDENDLIGGGDVAVGEKVDAMPNESSIIDDIQFTSNNQTGSGEDDGGRKIAPLDGFQTGRLSWEEVIQ